MSNFLPLIPFVPTAPLLHEDGKNLHQDWHLFFSQLVGALQKVLSNEGTLLPQQTTDNINLLTANKSIGALIYDSTTDEAKVNLNGAWKTITTS
jgi:hypothetical protein